MDHEDFLLDLAENAKKFIKEIVAEGLMQTISVLRDGYAYDFYVNIHRIAWWTYLEDRPDGRSLIKMKIVNEDEEFEGLISEESYELLESCHADKRC